MIRQLKTPADYRLERGTFTCRRRGRGGIPFGPVGGDGLGRLRSAAAACGLLWAKDMNANVVAVGGRNDDIPLESSGRGGAGHRGEGELLRRRSCPPSIRRHTNHGEHLASRLSAPLLPKRELQRAGAARKSTSTCKPIFGTAIPTSTRSAHGTCARNGMFDPGRFPMAAIGSAHSDSQNTFLSGKCLRITSSSARRANGRHLARPFTSRPKVAAPCGTRRPLYQDRNVQS